MIQFNFNVDAIRQWLAGKKTYLMIVIGALDQYGALQGWWTSDEFRQLIEATLGLTFLRMGVTASGPVVK